ncbi:C39 family peptidase [Candidatus Daviesbacteria bacterium]|nr:C39 family peptidase [Candidatus Daviesbacteria bacterium]
MILNVSYQAQLPYEDDPEVNKDWCGILCLWMVMSYYLKDQAPSVEQLLSKYGQQLKDNGFRHQDFLKIARDYNLRGFRKSWWAQPGVQPILEKFQQEGEGEQDIEDWLQTNLEEGIFTIENMINQNIPVIVSVNKEFSPSNTSHLILVVGCDDNNFIVHDPLHKGPNYKVSKEELKKYWIRQAIIIKPVNE